MERITNTIYKKRGLPFSIQDYPEEIQKLWAEKLKTVDEIVELLPSKFSFASAFLASQPRAFLRALGKRTNFESMELFGSFFIEPYEFLSFPQLTYRTFYFGPIERLLNNKMGKTVQYIPKQYTQINDTIDHYSPEYVFSIATVPNKEGFINLSLNNAADEPALREAIKNPSKKVILEINCYAPWVHGELEQPENDHCIHLSEVDYVYENHEPLFQMPNIIPTDVEKSIATYASKYIQDRDVIQFGIGGIPNYIATQITDKKDIGIHTEMLSDWVVDLAEKGVITNKYKEIYNGKTVCIFIVGSDKIYDWVDRNENVCILSAEKANSPLQIHKLSNFKSVNAGLMIDFNGQVCSETIGHKPYSGTGGQFEFVQGSFLSPGGRSVICIKTTNKDATKSNILSGLPSGAAVTVPRFFTDIIVTEYGAREIMYKSKHERTRELIEIAYPDFQDKLVEEAKKLKLWDEPKGFQKTSQKILYKSIPWIVRIKKMFSKKK